MLQASRSHRLRAIVSYLIVTIALALLLGIFRTVLLAIDSDHPARYLVYSVVANALLALLPGFFFFPLFAAASLAWLRPAGPPAHAVGAFAALLGVFPGFWVLTTPLGYWEPVFAAPLSLLKQLALWGALLALLAWALKRMLVSSGFPSFAARIAAASGALLAITLGLWVVPLFASARARANDLAGSSSARSRPNIFLVLVDTLRPDHLGAYGYDLTTSPNVEEFSREAVTYARAFAQAPWTRPSCASLLTSRYPLEIGTNGLFDALPAEIPILPEYLRAEGYATSGVVSSVQVSPIFGFDKGFDLLDIGNTKYMWAGLAIPLARLGRTEPTGTYPRYNAEELTDRAIRWLEEKRLAGRPLFVYLHYADPHAPYRPPVGADRWREFARGEGRSLAVPRDTPPLGIADVPPPEADALVARYDTEIAYFDVHFGSFLRYLKENGLYDGSLVILTADHGEEFGEHRGWEHGHSLYNELLHVPLIVKYPAGSGPPPGTRLDRITGLVDLLPTVKGLLGAAWESTAWRGVDLLGAERDRLLYAANDSPSLRAVYAPEGKLIQTLGPGNEVVAEAYYSLESDFVERAPIPLPSSEHSVLMLEEMRAWIAEIEAGALPPRRVDAPPETVEELKALGYVE